MSKGLGGLVVAQFMIEDMERYAGNRRERRAARHAARASRVRRRAGFVRRRAGRLEPSAATGQTPALER